jgi:hypothetical protein
MTPRSWISWSVDEFRHDGRRDAAKKQQAGGGKLSVVGTDARSTDAGSARKSPRDPRAAA